MSTADPMPAARAGLLILSLLAWTAIFVASGDAATAQSGDMVSVTDLVSGGSLDPRVPPYPEELEPDFIKTAAEKAGLICEAGTFKTESKSSDVDFEEYCQNADGDRHGIYLRFKKIKNGAPLIVGVENYCEGSRCGAHATWDTDGQLKTYEFLGDPRYQSGPGIRMDSRQHLEVEVPGAQGWLKIIVMLICLATIALSIWLNLTGTKRQKTGTDDE